MLTGRGDGSAETVGWRPVEPVEEELCDADQIIKGANEHVGVGRKSQAESGPRRGEGIPRLGPKLNI